MKDVKLNLNPWRFWPTIIILLAVCAIMYINVEAIQRYVNNVYNLIIDTFGWLYIVVDTLCVIIALYFIFGKYRNIRLGGENATSEYSTFSWAAMIFTSSCGAWLIVYGFLEPIYILSSPPFQLTPGSPLAYEYAQLYAHFHWGPSAWAIYVPVTVAIGLQIYNNSRTHNTLSIACRPAFNDNNNVWINRTIDIIAIFGAVCSPVISIGTGMPVITALIQDLFGLSPDTSLIVQIWILIVWTVFFVTSVTLGMKRGIRLFSNFNTATAFIYMGAVGLISGVVYIINSETNILGMMMTNFPRMQTYTDPYGGGTFVKGWTASYWGCYMVYMPLMGVFNAKISRGRSLKEISIALLVLCTLGCWVSMGTFGNYALQLQSSGIVDVMSILVDKGEAAAVLAIIQQMPFAKIMTAILIFLCVIFLSTTMDSSTMSLAEMTTNHSKGEDLAPRLPRFVWAAIACLLTVVLLAIGGYKSIRLMCLIMGLPLGILSVVVMWSCIKLIRKEYNKKQ